MLLNSEKTNFFCNITLISGDNGFLLSPNKDKEFEKDRYTLILKIKNLYQIEKF